MQQQGRYSHLQANAAQIVCKALTMSVNNQCGITATAIALLLFVLIGALGE